MSDERQENCNALRAMATASGALAAYYRRAVAQCMPRPVLLLLDLREALARNIIDAVRGDGFSEKCDAMACQANRLVPGQGFKTIPSTILALPFDLVCEVAETAAPGWFDRTAAELPRGTLPVLVISGNSLCLHGEPMPHPPVSAN